LACQTGSVTSSSAPLPPPSSRIDSLDVLRGLMALAVAVYHISIWTDFFPAGTRTNNLVAILGNYGVEGFFIVSGFCFFFLYGDVRWDRGELARFHIKRFFRIAPLYYLAVFLNLALRQNVGPSFSWRYLAENLTLSFGLFHPNHAMVLGGWSIGIEYVFYLAFPLLAFLTRRKWMLYLLAAAFILMAYPWTFGAVQAASHIGEQKFHAYVQIPNHAFLFLLGGILAHLRTLIPWRLTYYLFLPALGLLLWAAMPRELPFYDHFEVMAGMPRVKYAVFCFLIVGLAAFFEMPRSILVRPFVWLGDASYSVYLLHPFTFAAVKQVLPGTWHGAGLFWISLATTLLLATLVYRYMEKPAIRLGRRMAGRFEKP